MQPPSPRGQEIVPLTSIRGIAAVWVVALHLSQELTQRHWISPPSGVLAHLVAGGDAAVDLFFVLSGYIIARTYGRRTDLGRFFAHRCARILALHWTVLTLMALMVGAMELMGMRPKDPSFFAFGTLVYQYTLTSAWVGQVNWNTPTWSLDAEAAAYAVFPLLQLVARRAKAPALAAIALGCVAGHVATIGLAGFGVWGWPALARGLFGFGAGASLWYAAETRTAPRWLAPAAAAVMAGMAATGQYQAAALPFAALVIGLGNSAGGAFAGWMSAAPLAWLGRVSFSIYLLHTPILLAVVQVMDRIPALRASPAATAACATAYGVLTLVAAEAGWRLIETPARRYLRRQGDAVFAAKPPRL